LEPLKHNKKYYTIYLLINKQIEKNKINMQPIYKTYKRTYLEAASTQGASKPESNALAKLMSNSSTHKNNPTPILNEYPISISRHPILVHNSGIPANQNLEKRQKLPQSVSSQQLNEQRENDQVESGIPVNLESPLAVHLTNPLRNNLFNMIGKDYSSTDLVGHQTVKSSVGEPDKHSYQLPQIKESLSLIHNSGIPVVNQSTNPPYSMEGNKKATQDHYQNDLHIRTEPLILDNGQAEATPSDTHKARRKVQKTVKSFYHELASRVNQYKAPATKYTFSHFSKGISSTSCQDRVKTFLIDELPIDIKVAICEFVLESVHLTKSVLTASVVTELYKQEMWARSECPEFPQLTWSNDLDRQLYLFACFSAPIRQMQFLPFNQEFIRTLPMYREYYSVSDFMNQKGATSDTDDRHTTKGTRSHAR